MRKRVVLCSLIFILGACSGSTPSNDAAVTSGELDTSDGASDSAATSSTTGTTSEASEASSTVPDTTVLTTTTTVETTTTNEFGGQPYEIGLAEGQPLAVVGVRYDDELNVREAPDPTSNIVATVAPLSQSPTLLSGGNGLLLPDSAWWAVTVDGKPGWVNATFIGGLGTTLDIFGQLYDGVVPDEASTLQALAEVIGEKRAGGPVPLVVFVTEPESDDSIGGRVLFDIVGIGDDSLKGERVEMQFELVWDNPVADNREVVGYRPVALTSTAICGRGLSTDQICT